MKRNILLSLAAASLATTPIIAQNLVDATRFSSTDISGTARYRSMGGAFGALGGDPTCMVDNPAGIGIYRGTSELSMSLNWSASRAKSMGDFINTEKKHDFNIDNLSYILSIKTPDCENLVNFNIGVGFNHSANVSRKYKAQLNNPGSSFDTYLANLTNNALLINGYYDDPSYLGTDNAWNNSGIPLMGLMAYDVYAVDNAKNNRGVTPYSESENVSAAQGRLAVREENRLDEYNICASGNWNDFFYAGVTISIADFNSTIKSEFAEDYSNGSYTDYDNQLETKGSGVGIKLGAIIKPTDSWRIGAAIHTPTWYDMKDFYSGQIYTDNASGNENYCNSDREHELPYEYHYRFSTPWVYQLSTAYVIGTRAILSFEYDMTDYRSMRYSSSNEDDWNFHEDFSWQKQAIKDYMQEMHTIKVGAEYRLSKQWSARAGFVHQTSPYKDEIYDTRNRWMGDEEVIYSSSTKPNYTLQGNTNYVSFGLGYRINQWFFDLTCMQKTQFEKVGFFPTSDAVMNVEHGHVTEYSSSKEYYAVTAPQSDLKTKTLNFDFTFGYKF